MLYRRENNILGNLWKNVSEHDDKKRRHFLTAVREQVESWLSEKGFLSLFGSFVHALLQMKTGGGG